MLLQPPERLPLSYQLVLAAEDTKRARRGAEKKVAATVAAAAATAAATAATAAATAATASAVHKDGWARRSLVPRATRRRRGPPGAQRGTKQKSAASARQDGEGGARRASPLRCRT